MRNAIAGFVFLVLTLSTPPLLAATVSIQGTGILFEAGNGETNTVLLQGTVIDDSLGDGFMIIDSTANLIITSGQGCRAQGSRVVCEITPTFVKLELGDKNDSVISQEAVRMIVNGGKGNDTITGSAADDDLDGDRDNDTIDGGRGNDVIRGGLGDDQLTGGLGNDRLIGSTGSDTLDGGPDNDELDSGIGADRLIGGSGIDRFEAGAGKDVINAQDGVAETVRCGGGNDTVTKDANDKTSRCR
jgi:Ca2+-binding RTX toxin-like protein